jgi:sodium transport system permease protein
MSQFLALYKKELKEAFRDKRALAAALLMAVMAPVMIFAISKMAIKEAVETPPIYVNIQGVEFAPKLMAQLKSDNILPITQVPEQEQALWLERNVQLLIPSSFATDLLDGKTIDIILQADFGEKSLTAPLRRIRESIQDYARLIGYKRLLMRGIDARLLNPVKLLEQDTAAPSNNAKFISLMLGIYLLMAAFMSGLSVAIDSSAGERERNVLEILLCQPVTTHKVVLAKLCTASLIAVIGVVLTLTLTTFAVGFIDLTKIGASFNLDGFAIVSLLLLLVPICFFASSLQLFFAFQAKSFKEAQSIVSMIIILPALVPMMLTFVDDKPKWLDWMPISGQSLLMEDLFKNVPISWNALCFTGIVTIAITIGLVQATAIKLRSEKVVLALS